MYLWGLLLNLKGERDYLQVFYLSNYKGKQKIIHVSEEPKYRKEHIICAGDNIIAAKIYIIEDLDYFTMLYPSER